MAELRCSTHTCLHARDGGAAGRSQRARNHHSALHLKVAAAAPPSMELAILTTDKAAAHAPRARTCTCTCGSCTCAPASVGPPPGIETPGSMWGACACRGRWCHHPAVTAPPALPRSAGSRDCSGQGSPTPASCARALAPRPARL
eukprot:1159260-Pelagomonas_calceolata.AAC.7